MFCLRRYFQLMLVIAGSFFLVNSASAQISRPAAPPSVADLASPTDVSVTLEILEKLAVRVRMTFKTKADVKDPLMAIAGFDIAIEHREFGDIAKDLKKSGMSALAVVVGGSSQREVWFGKTIEPGQHSADLVLDFPGFVKAREAKNYSLEFLVVPGDRRLISNASRTISVAKLSDVTLKLPEGWRLDDNNWKLSSVSENRYGYKGSLASGEAVQALLVRPALAVQEWLQEHIAMFFTVLLFVLVVIVAIIKLLIKKGFRQIVAKAFVLGFGMLLVAYVWYDYRDVGSQGWFERDWWLISSIAAIALAIVLPVSLVSFLVDELRRQEPVKHP